MEKLLAHPFAESEVKRMTETTVATISPSCAVDMAYSKIFSSRREKLKSNIFIPGKTLFSMQKLSSKIAPNEIQHFQHY